MIDYRDHTLWLLSSTDQHNLLSQTPSAIVFLSLELRCLPMRDFPRDLETCREWLVLSCNGWARQRLGMGGGRVL